MLTDGLVKCLEIFKKRDSSLDIKKLLMLLALGKFDDSPFDMQTLDDVRADFRIVCKRSGHGDGLPREGDVVQLFEVRLIQSMLSAFQDPDHHY